jgi:hypothetical protein
MKYYLTLIVFSLLSLLFLAAYMQHSESGRYILISENDFVGTQIYFDGLDSVMKDNNYKLLLDTQTGAIAMLSYRPLEKGGLQLNTIVNPLPFACRAFGHCNKEEFDRLVLELINTKPENK